VAVGQIVAKREAGDVQGAAAALQTLSEQFNAFTAAQDAFVISQEQKATSANDSADSADTAAGWLMLSAAAVGLFLVFGTSVVLVRKFARRRVAATASS
jgi:hypothetical protein